MQKSYGTQIDDFPLSLQLCIFLAPVEGKMNDGIRKKSTRNLLVALRIRDIVFFKLDRMIDEYSVIS